MTMKPEDKEFIFEHIIERKGCYYMHPDSLHEHNSDPDFQRKIRRQGLKFRYVESIGHFKFYYVW